MDDVDRRLLRDGVAIGAAVGVVGLSFGLLARAAGISALHACAMSLAIFAGGSQLLLVGVVTAGGELAAGVVAALVLNARHIAFGLSLAPVLRSPLAQRLVSAQMVVDESTAFALAQPDPARSRRAFFIVGATLFVCWNAGTALGALGGGLVDDPAAIGLDAAFPAGLLAVIAPQLRVPAVRAAALAGALLAAAATPLLPAGGPLFVAPLGALAGSLIERRRS
jgi:4-azaleucine resistance transporter AzlC